MVDHHSISSLEWGKLGMASLGFDPDKFSVSEFYLVLEGAREGEVLLFLFLRQTLRPLNWPLQLEAKKVWENNERKTEVWQ